MSLAAAAAVASIVSAVLGAAVSAATALAMLRKPVRDLQERVHGLEEQRTAARLAELGRAQERLESRLEEHLQADPSRVILSQLEACNAQLSRISAKLDRLAEATAAQAAAITANERYTENLDRAIQRIQEQRTPHA